MFSTLKQQLKKQGWSIQWNTELLDDSSNVENLSPEQVIDTVNAFPVVLKDDKRSLVIRGDFLGHNVIAKKARDKNRRRWAQFLSLFKPAEALKSFQGLAEFSRKSINAAKPIAVLEKHKYGAVFDSWLIYQFIEGDVTSKDDLPDIIQSIDYLHQKDYQHADPHCDNFLRDSNGDIVFIDCKGKKRLGHFSDCFDYLLLQNYYPDVSDEFIQRFAKFDTQSTAYKLAKTYNGYRKGRSKLKSILRKRK